MRGSSPQGRFSIDYEAASIYEGIADDMGRPIGTDVDWWQWEETSFQTTYRAVVDDIYDVSSAVYGGGRRWSLPFKMPVLMAQLIRSTNVMNERGFYVTDTLRLVLNAGDAERLLPTLLSNSTMHIKDRVVYRGEVFVPTRVLPRGSFANRWAVVTIDCNQMNADELVNDPQFQIYASPSVRDPENDPYGYGLLGYGQTPYGD